MDTHTHTYSSYIIGNLKKKKKKKIHFPLVYCLGYTDNCLQQIYGSQRSRRYPRERGMVAPLVRINRLLFHLNLHPAAITPPPSKPLVRIPFRITYPAHCLRGGFLVRDLFIYPYIVQHLIPFENQTGPAELFGEEWTGISFLDLPIFLQIWNQMLHVHMYIISYHCRFLDRSSHAELAGLLYIRLLCVIAPEQQKKRLRQVNRENS